MWSHVSAPFKCCIVFHYLTYHICFIRSSVAKHSACSYFLALTPYARMNIHMHSGAAVTKCHTLHGRSKRNSLFFLVLEARSSRSECWQDESFRRLEEGSVPCFPLASAFLLTVFRVSRLAGASAPGLPFCSYGFSL